MQGIKGRFAPFFAVRKDGNELFIVKHRAFCYTIYIFLEDL